MASDTSKSEPLGCRGFVISTLSLCKTIWQQIFGVKRGSRRRQSCGLGSGVEFLPDSSAKTGRKEVRKLVVHQLPSLLGSRSRQRHLISPAAKAKDGIRTTSD